MISFLKGIGKGLFYVLFLPFGLISIALYAIFGVFVFIYRFIKLIYLFFSGRNLKTELKEDEEVRKIMETNKPVEEKPEEPSMSLYPRDSEMYKTEYVSPTFEDKPEEPQQEEKQEDSSNE